MNKLNTRLRALTSEQIRVLMSKTTGVSTAEASIQPDKDGFLPVSRGQERMWFLSQLYAETADYNIPLSVMVEGVVVERASLQRNVNAVVASQEILRTTFHESNGVVLQSVHPELHLDVAFEDRSADYATGGDALAHALAVEHGAMRFRLDRLPLFAVKLIKLAPRSYLVLLNLHHIISDGWSNSLLSQLLQTPADAPLPERPTRQYRDFVAYERAWLRGKEYRAQLAFWLEYLNHPPRPPVFMKPGDRDTGKASGYVSVEIPASLHERIAKHCSLTVGTPFQYYISCFALLMTRYANADDLIIGTPIANRTRPEFLRTCGMFINTLPLRFVVDPGKGIGEALSDCTAGVVKALQHQELPYSELVKHVQMDRQLSENPLFNLHFVFQHFPDWKSSNAFRLLPVDHGASKFDLNCVVDISGAGNRLTLTYRRCAFDTTDIDYLAAGFIHVLELGLNAPAGALREIEFLPAEGLSSLAGPVVQRPSGNWYALFARAVQTWPTRAACVDMNGSLTYSELDTLVERAAAALSEQGVTRGDRVLLRASRDRHYVIGLLACLRVHASYLPVLDDAPQALLDQIEREAGAKLVLGTPVVGCLPQLRFTDALAASSHPAAPFAVSSGDDEAYVVYTSGSTGTPKGVVVTHRGLVNYTLALLERLDDPSLSSFAHLSALDADLGNTAIFPALASGAALLMPDAACLLDARRLAAFFAAYPADVAKMVPPHLRAMKGHLADILPRRVLICGGDSLDPELVHAVRDAMPALRVLNHYGPAETTIGVLTHEVTIDAPARVALGTPLANTRVYLLDKHGRAVPRGIAGEIGIAGAGVATGYLEKPELTARRFVKMAFDGGERLYRSGDRAMLDTNGEFIFLGRDDNRVKISGVMVQPEEMAAMLMRHPAVTAAYAWAQGGVDGNARLMAAVVLGEQVEMSELRAYLMGSYRSAQCPALVAVPGLPLNANGKVDAHALRRAWNTQGDSTANTPRDPVELELQGLFEALLERSGVPLAAGFFDLGGTSLQAISLITRLNATFGLALPAATLFEASSVQSLAEIVRQQGRNDDRSLVTLSDRGQEVLLVWVHPAGGNAMCYVPIARQLSSARASVAFNAFGREAGAGIDTLAREYHRALQQRYGSTRRIVLIGWSMGALIAHEMAVLAAESGCSVPLVMLDQPVPDATVKRLSYEDRVQQYLEKVEVFTGSRIGIQHESNREVDFERVLHAFQRLGLMPADTSASQLRFFLDVLVHDNENVSRFRPRAHFGAALLLRAREQVRLRHSMPEAVTDTDDLGWRAHCSNLDVGHADGNHMTMLNTSNAVKLAGALDAWLRTQDM